MAHPLLDWHRCLALVQVSAPATPGDAQRRPATPGGAISRADRMNTVRANRKYDDDDDNEDDDDDERTIS